jgi:hypothetical protein
MNIKVIGLLTCIDGVFYDFINGAYVSVLNQVIDGIVGVRCIYILNKESKTKKKKRRSRTK